MPRIREDILTPQAMSGSLFGVGILSSAISGFSQYESGQQQKQAYDYNADITLQNTNMRLAANQQQYETQAGRQANAYAASGVDIASGSPLLIMAATRARGGVSGAQIKQQGDEQASMDEYYGKLAAWQGTMGGIGTFLKGITGSALSYRAATTSLPLDDGYAMTPAGPAAGLV